mmetsp:Transcript_132183/g.329632  ORF Transcript_132183/g.329632 Transcript_132183/m.329632 type:complete len:222 (-) Transcript_132183:260-925(-)
MVHLPRFHLVCHDGCVGTLHSLDLPGMLVVSLPKLPFQPLDALLQLQVRGIPREVVLRHQIGPLLNVLTDRAVQVLAHPLLLRHFVMRMLDLRMRRCQLLHVFVVLFQGVAKQLLYVIHALPQGCVDRVDRVPRIPLFLKASLDVAVMFFPKCSLLHDIAMYEIDLSMGFSQLPLVLGKLFVHPTLQIVKALADCDAMLLLHALALLNMTMYDVKLFVRRG